MQASNGKVVVLGYTLTGSKNNEPEELIEKTDDHHPFAFLFGHGGVLPDFETNLASKQKGDKFDFHIKAENAYGNFEKDYVVKVNKEAFMIDGKFDSNRVKVDADVEMRDQEGNPLIGRVLQITDAFVEMDFNHPLAGFDLHFLGDVLEVRDATAEEMDHGHVHGPGGHHH
ncbi:MAG: slyD [Bacteroidetes bacterium]|jgi:FKBP-type peptidyl-prolyl cis-trans isomerase SlyD|nr:slyD [Bacteroidota bacterium]